MRITRERRRKGVALPKKYKVEIHISSLKDEDEGIATILEVSRKKLLANKILRPLLKELDRWTWTDYKGGRNVNS